MRHICTEHTLVVPDSFAKTLDLEALLPWLSFSRLDPLDNVYAWALPLQEIILTILFLLLRSLYQTL